MKGTELIEKFKLHGWQELEGSKGRRVILWRKGDDAMVRINPDIDYTDLEVERLLEMLQR